MISKPSGALNSDWRGRRPWTLPMGAQWLTAVVALNWLVHTVQATPVINTICPTQLPAPVNGGQFFVGTLVLTGTGFQGANLTTDGPLSLVNGTRADAAGTVIEQDYVIGCCGPTQDQVFHLYVNTPGGSTSGQLSITLASQPAAPCASTLQGAHPTFGNLSSITVNDNAAATPYPSTLSVAGLSGGIRKLTVTLSGVTHNRPEDLDVLLVSPPGQKVVLMGQAGGANPANILSLTFDDVSLPVSDNGPLFAGTYKVADYAVGDLPAPAPAGPYATTLSALNGSPNGLWQLYVVDRVTGEAGQISGWSLTFWLEPTVSPIANASTPEDVPISIPFTIGDAETLASSLVVTASSSNQALVPNPNISITGTGASRTLNITPGANGSGTTFISVTVRDLDGFTTSSLFSLTVNPVNDAPTMSAIPNQFVPANGSVGAIPFTVGDVEDLPSNLALTAFSSNQGLIPDGNLSLGGSGANRTLQITPAANATGSATVTVRVADSSGSLSSVSFNVLVYQPFNSLLSYSINFPGFMSPGVTTSLGQGNFDVTSPGYGICCTSDTFHYSYTAVTGNFDARVRVARLDNSSRYATAGLMLRQNLSPGAANVDVEVTPTAGDNSYGVGVRTVQGGDTDFGLISGGAGVTIPNAWMRLTRQGNVITAYRSTDGITWTQEGQITQVFSDPVLVGLATTGNNGTTTTAQFRNFQLMATAAAPLAVVPALPPLLAPGDAIVGVAAAPGSATSALATQGIVFNSNSYPAGQSADKSIDGNAGSKYLNFAKINTGFIVTLPGAATVAGFQFTAGDDRNDRDPINVTIEGANSSDPTTAAHGASWTLLYNGPSGLATDPGRLGNGSIVLFANNASFNSYRVLVTGVRNAATAESMQFGEIQFFPPASPLTGAFADLGLATAVVNALGRSSGAVYLPEVQGLTSLNAQNRALGSLTGLENAINLHDANFSLNQISNLSPLSGLTGLQYLELNNTAVTDLTPVLSLTRLNNLQFVNNPNANVSVLGSMAWLQILNLAGNKLSDISFLQTITGLQGLVVNNNWVSEISVLGGLPALVDVWLDHNFLDLSAGASAADVVAGLINRGVTVHATPQNPLPADFSSIGSQFLFLGQTIPEMPFTAGDPARAGQILNLVAISSDQSVIPDANIILRGKGSVHTWQLTGAVGPGTATVTITVNYASGIPSSVSHAFSVSVFPAGLGNLFIEAEDFNFGGGQHLAVADTMPYAGGAYAGLGAVPGVDYFLTNAGPSPDSDNYRTGENPNVGIITNADINRGSYDLAVNYKVGWNDDGEWYNYTRNFAGPVYNVYARLSSGGADMHDQLDEVTSGASTASQSTTKLGTFDAPTTGGWDTFTFVPLRTAAGNLARVRFTGEHTVRWTKLPGASDINYLAFIPADMDPDISAQPGDQSLTAGGSVSLPVTATGSGTVTYQWKKAGVPLGGQTASALTFANLQTTDSGSYTVVVTSAGGTLESEPFTLTVLPNAPVTTVGNPVADARIISGAQADETQGNFYMLSLYNDGSDNVHHVTMRFDMPPFVPGRTVSSAILKLNADPTFYTSGNPSGRNMEVYRLTQPWTEASVSWNNRSAGIPWTAPGGDFVGTSGNAGVDPYANNNATVPDNYPNPTALTWDVTQLAQEWYSGLRANHGLLLLSYAGNYLHFRGREFSGGGIPELEITTIPAPDLHLTFVSQLTGSGQVIVGFDQALDPTSASNPLNFTLSGGAVSSATVRPDGKSVLLQVSGLTGTALNLQVNNVKSFANKVIAPGSSVSGTVSPIQAVDIGTPGDPVQPGATYPVGADGFDVVAGGSDIWGNADHFHFAYQPWVGDFDARVHVSWFEQGGFDAKASIMVRQDLSAGSLNAKADLTSFTGNNSHEAQARSAVDGPTGSWGLSSGSASGQPWLRLRRQGDTLTAYRSSDGVNWIPDGSLVLPLADPVLLGLGTSANVNSPGQAARAQYRNYSVSVPPPLLKLETLDASASEAGADPGLFRISISGDRSQPFTANYTLSGTADNGVDFETLLDSVTVPAGQKSVVIPVRPLVDGLVENYEFVTLRLGAVPGVEMGSATGTVGIFDDNPTPRFLKRELYLGIPGTAISTLTSASRFPNSPDFADVISTLESPAPPQTTLGDSYGQRLSGLLKPDMSGDYTFYIAADDQAELWLSTDENPVHKARIAYEPQWNSARAWTSTTQRNPSSPENKSAPIPLVAGQKYYVEVIHKEGGGGDNVAVAWQKPGDPIPVDGSDPISGAYLELRVPLAISSLSPSAIQSGNPDFPLTVNGSGFVVGAKVFWNGTERVTSLVNSKQLNATILAADIASSDQIKTATVQVQNPGGEESNMSAFTIGSAAVAVVDSSVIPPGATGVVSTAPVSGDSPPAGVEATFTHSSDAPPATVTAATYNTNPNAGTIFDVGAGFVDLKVAGAAPSDSMSANFYYPPTITGQTEADLVLLYLNGSDWQPVLSSGGATPGKDTTDNVDGSVSGGRFSVLFDATSTPKVTELSGTVFTPTTSTVANDITPPTPDQDPLPDLSHDCSITLTPPTATDAVTGKVTGTSGHLSFSVPGIYLVDWAYDDGNGNVSHQTQKVVVRKPQPAPGTITPSLSLALVGATIGVQCPFTDLCGGRHTAQWNWDDGSKSSGTVNEVNGSGTVGGSHHFTTAGTYAIELTVTDQFGVSGKSVYQFLIVYDPNAGALSGSGWINSPAGAYRANPGATGKASFNFGAKYQKGATAPSGQTDFQLEFANFKFHSASYDWLVVSGAKAQYKGSGTVNNTGSYGFLLSVTDGQISGGGGADKFRIRVWNKANGQTVYDNVPGASDDLDAASPQTLGGGGITISK